MLLDDKALGLLTFVVAVAAYIAAVSLVIQGRIGDSKRRNDPTDVDTIAEISWKRRRVFLLTIGEIPLVLSAIYLTIRSLWPALPWGRYEKLEYFVRYLITIDLIYLVSIHLWSALVFIRDRICKRSEKTKEMHPPAGKSTFTLSIRNLKLSFDGDVKYTTGSADDETKPAQDLIKCEVKRKDQSGRNIIWQWAGAFFFIGTCAFMLRVLTRNKSHCRKTKAGYY